MKEERQRKRNDYSVIEQNALTGNYMENILKGSHPKMTGQNDRQDESLTGQVHDQVRHSGLLIFRAVADPRNSGISTKSREIPPKKRNTAKSARNISKYMSAKHI